MKHPIRWFLAIASLLFVTLGSVCSVARSDVLSVVTDGAFGAMLRDTSSGLDWLKISSDTTLGASFSEVKTRLGVGQDLAGFRFATSQELDNLVEHAGYDGNATGTQGSFDSIKFLIDALGVTRESSDSEVGFYFGHSYYSTGMLAYSILQIPLPPPCLGCELYLDRFVIPVANLAALRRDYVSGSTLFGSGYDNSYDSLTYDGYPEPDQTADPYRGAFLVRDTPGFVSVAEPTALALLAMGLPALGLARRRKNQ